MKSAKLNKVHKNSKAKRASLDNKNPPNQDLNCFDQPISDSPNPSNKKNPNKNLYQAPKQPQYIESAFQDAKVCVSELASSIYDDLPDIRPNKIPSEEELPDIDGGLQINTPPPLGNYHLIKVPTKPKYKNNQSSVSQSTLYDNPNKNAAISNHQNSSYNNPELQEEPLPDISGNGNLSSIQLDPFDDLPDISANLSNFQYSPPNPIFLLSKKPYIPPSSNNGSAPILSSQTPTSPGPLFPKKIIQPPNNDSSSNLSNPLKTPINPAPIFPKAPLSQQSLNYDTLTSNASLETEADLSVGINNSKINQLSNISQPQDLSSEDDLPNISGDPIIFKKDYLLTKFPTKNETIIIEIPTKCAFCEKDRHKSDFFPMNYGNEKELICKMCWNICTLSEENEKIEIKNKCSTCEEWNHRYFGEQVCPNNCIVCQDCQYSYIFNCKIRGKKEESCVFCNRNLIKKTKPWSIVTK